MVRPNIVIAHSARRHYWLTCRTLIKEPPNFIPRTPSRSVVNTKPSSSMGELSSIVPCQGAGTLDDVMARSKNSSEVQTVVLTLPDVPRIPARKRTFHLHHEDLEPLVRPLLSSHWHVGQVGGDEPKVLSLDKLFTLKDFRSAVAFFDALADIQDEEDHHARVTVEYAHIHVSTHTHVAYQHASDADAKPVRVPGLTSRDVRFAIQVERLHDTFLSDGRAVTKVPVGSAELQAWSMGQLRRRYPVPAA